MIARQEIMWDLIVSEGDEFYYIDDAEGPAFILLHRYNPLTRDSFHLYMNEVGRIISTRSEKEVREKLIQALNTAAKKIKVFKMVRRGRKKNKKILFGEFPRCSDTPTEGEK